MSLESHILAVVRAIGADVKALFTGKQDTLVSGENIKTVNGRSLLGSGDLQVSGGTANALQIVTSAPQRITGGAVRLPSPPLGDIVWGRALVFEGLTDSDLDTSGQLLGTRDYVVQEHLVRTVGDLVIFSSTDLDGLHAVVSYLSAAS